ncbi:MAG: hypothetical protein KGD63_10015 [Candidatus Lokiarchaeota archaeon]|nr:hypothetical protein [Candidatus Lokiarchaeota archaeon]
MSQINDVEIQLEILKYIESKGILKACLLFKLEKWILNRFSHNCLIRKRDINRNIISLLKKKKIDLIIPHFFKIKWQVRELENLKYLENGNYLIRTIIKENNDWDQYYFDTRTKNNINEQKSIRLLQDILKLKGEKKKKIILYLTSNIKPLVIYDKFDDNYRLDQSDIIIPNNFEVIKKKISIPLNEQQNYQLVIYRYRKKYMCFYITIIETIQNIIVNLITQKNNHQYFKKKIVDLKTKFAFYCYLFVTNDWIDVKPNPYKWESFFKYYNLPISINLSFNNVKFTGRTFEFYIKFSYQIKIKTYAKSTIQYLKRLGYEVINMDMDTVSIGYTHNVFIPCSSIEYFYFCGKYIFFYYLFLLFYNTHKYIKKEYTSYNFSKNDRDLYKVFLPITKLISNFKEKKLEKNIIFKYYSKDPDELEIIYNKFLLPLVKPIENRLYNYFLIRGIFKKDSISSI